MNAVEMICVKRFCGLYRDLWKKIVQSEGLNIYVDGSMLQTGIDIQKLCALLVSCLKLQIFNEIFEKCYFYCLISIKKLRLYSFE